MRIIRLNTESLEQILADKSGLEPLQVAPSGIALGCFDGLHRGHQELVAALCAAKQRGGLKASVVLTFHQHPRLVLEDVVGPFLLTTLQEKLSLLEQLGVDVVVVMDFTLGLSRLDYRVFVQRFLVDWLGMSCLVAGQDVHLGKGRGGDAAALAALGSELGYTLEVLQGTAWRGRMVSSSEIRRALSAGDCAAATAMLGRPYAVWGEVRPGQGRGRTIGYPTANMVPLNSHKLLPLPGVYACRVQVPGDVIVQDSNRLLSFIDDSLQEMDRHDGFVASGHSHWRLYGGMLNFGSVPTFHMGGLERPRIEVHLLDFSGDLRGRTIKVEWLQRLRDEKRFAGGDDLLTQLRADEQRSRQIISALGRSEGCCESCVQGE